MERLPGQLILKCLADKSCLELLNKSSNPKTFQIMDPKFEAGLNIALKIPKRTYEQSISFDQDVLHLEVEEKP